MNKIVVFSSIAALVIFAVIFNIKMYQNIYQKTEAECNVSGDCKNGLNCKEGQSCGSYHSDICYKGIVKDGKCKMHIDALQLVSAIMMIVAIIALIIGIVVKK